MNFNKMKRRQRFLILIKQKEKEEESLNLFKNVIELEKEGTEIGEEKGQII